MSLTVDELAGIAPEVLELGKLITEALKKDPDGKVRVTKEEGQKIRALILKLSVKIAKDAID
jgi:hypothetical protein